MKNIFFFCKICNRTACMNRVFCILWCNNCASQVPAQQVSPLATCINCGEKPTAAWCQFLKVKIRGRFIPNAVPPDFARQCESNIFCGIFDVRFRLKSIFFANKSCRTVFLNFLYFLLVTNEMKISRIIDKP